MVECRAADISDVGLHAKCWLKIAPRLHAEAEQLMKVSLMVRPLMLGCGPREGALRNTQSSFHH